MSPIIRSDTVRIDERADADSPEVQARIAVATDGVDHEVDPTRRDPAVVERAVEQPSDVETATAAFVPAPPPADPPADD